jgi:BirA family transcriptional regulator, biotin operon repressor / biotin---[acetyl-CoA-carboxylase] ligase
VDPATPAIVRLQSVASTQDVARNLAIGSVVVADFQSAGRGRLEHQWEAPPGTALLASFVLAPNRLLSLAAGVAAAEACRANVRLKWPNDLMVAGRKVGGILVEATPARAICGIGINLTWAPPGGATLGQPRDHLLESLIPEIRKWTSAPDNEILARWRDLSDTIGRRVRIVLPDRFIEGVADDIGAGGELIVDGSPMSAGSLVYVSGG